MSSSSLHHESPSRFQVVYRITRRNETSIESLARDLVIEQTVECPPESLSQEILGKRIVGEIQEMVPMDSIQGAFDVTVSYRSDTTGFTVPQFLNVLFGNTSIKNNVSIQDIRFDTSLHQAFRGPGFGVAGIRELLGVYGRPLACTAIKPMGLTTGQLAELTTQFALGGADIVKDDHGISNQHFHPFEQRVCACQEAITKANARTGKNSMYFPMISGRFDQLERQVQWAVRQGIRGILIAPFLVGPDTVRYLSETYNLIIMGHPALSGTFFHDPSHGMPPAVLLGTIFRMLGADISIFPHAGGRFAFTEKQCSDLANTLRRDEGQWKKSYPCPAGGMSLDRIEAMSALYGVDTVFLIGGAILKHPEGVLEGTRVFMDRIREHFPNEQARRVSDESPSSCELPARRQGFGPATVLRHKDYRWSDREVTAYKSDDSCSFRGISRQELTGPFGEQTSFDVRYFEIEPGGHSSKERHAHEHIIIGVRGTGKLLKGSVLIDVNIHDVARVATMEPHQLRNDSTEPFGFFCIVDHNRDRPIPVE